MYCGVIGHADRGCITRKTDILNDKLNEGQFGDWLRASDNMASRQSTKFQRPNDEKEQRISVDKPMPTEEGGTESNVAQHENILGRKDGLGVEPLSLDLLIEKPDDVLLTQHKGQTKEPHDLQLANTDQYKTLEPVAKAECNKENVGGAANSSLTNVCVRLSKARVPLAEIQSPTTGNGVGKGIGGKGTRRSTKKGNIGISIREPMDITKEPADSVCGRKRPLTLLDEDEEICAGDLKKRKGDTYDEMEQDIQNLTMGGWIDDDNGKRIQAWAAFRDEIFDPVEAQLLGIRQAMCYGFRIRCKRIAIRLDDKAIVERLNKREQFQDFDPLEDWHQTVTINFFFVFLVSAASGSFQ
ncbi:hypothetical protein DH2020_041632 [Rehmannia glutinosa]|uniref:RNase H type-1 domain-containing protein n=1 Tax=Rehmannia glutinosa TaxID=99300 RepID=A0ABR0UPP9_REHGL